MKTAPTTATSEKPSKYVGQYLEIPEYTKYERSIKREQRQLPRSFLSVSFRIKLSRLKSLRKNRCRQWTHRQSSGGRDRFNGSRDH